EVDYFRFEARAGQEVGVQAITAAAGSRLEPVLQLTDAAGQVVAEGTAFLGYTCLRAGVYALGVRDRNFGGGAGAYYPLPGGDIPVVRAGVPVGPRRGPTTDVRLEGVNLGPNRTLPGKAPPDAAPGTKLSVPVTTPAGPALGSPTVVVGEFPEEQLVQPAGEVPVRTREGGRIVHPPGT